MSVIYQTSLPVIWEKYNEPDIDLSDDAILGYHLQICRFADRNTIMKLIKQLDEYKKQKPDIDTLLFDYFHSFYRDLLRNT